jgi:hypothetical protein
LKATLRESEHNWSEFSKDKESCEKGHRFQRPGQLRPPFYAALETYWQLVREWADSVIGQLKQKFETYAESYRAQAEQLLGGKRRSRRPGRESGAVKAESRGGFPEVNSTPGIDVTQQTSERA